MEALFVMQVKGRHAAKSWDKPVRLDKGPPTQDPFVCSTQEKLTILFKDPKTPGREDT